MIVLVIVCWIALVLVRTVAPRRSNLSEFELARRLEVGHDSETKFEWRREETWRDILALQRVIESVLAVVIVAALVVEYGALLGCAAAIGLLLAAVPVAMIRPLRHITQARYDQYEARILPRVQLMHGYLRPFRGLVTRPAGGEIQSREELLHAVDRIDHLLTTDEQTMIRGALSFGDKRVKEYMTPRSMMEAIGANELLGPLVLDDMHKTGHSHFPVLEGDIDHIVGILHIHSLLTLENKKSHVVKDVMEPHVYYIHEDQSLADTLAACIKKRRHLLVVINEFRETVGVITIEDAVEQLIGHKIVDQFAEHDDLRAVAARNPRRNNAPKHHVDV